MKLNILEPLKIYLESDDIVPAVDFLLKASSEKKLEEGADWLDQTEFRHAWLAAREIYAAMHEQGALIWKAIWMQNPFWEMAGLKKLSVAEMRAQELSEPSMEAMWREEWFGGPFRTNLGEIVGLYVYVNREGVYLNIWYPELTIAPKGWERDVEESEEMNTTRVCRWEQSSINLAGLIDSASVMLQLLAAR